MPLLKKEIKNRQKSKALNSALLLFLVLLIIAVSGCVANFPFAQKKLVPLIIPTIVSETQDLVLKAEAVPLEARSGKRLDLYFELDALKDLKDVSFSITDTCLFSGDYAGVFEKQDMKENKTRDFKLTLTAGNVNFDTDCQIRFRASYSASLIAAQDIIVLTDAEFLTEQRNGKINERIARFVTTDNPLQITFSFSNPQPFEDKADEFMYINYAADSGLEKLQKGSVQFTAPNNVKIACDDYTAEGNKFTLNRDLVFIGGRAKKSTCKLATNAREPADSKTLQITANYLYTIDNSINVKIKPK